MVAHLCTRLYCVHVFMLYMHSPHDIKFQAGIVCVPTWMILNAQIVGGLPVYSVDVVTTRNNIAGRHNLSIIQNQSGRHRMVRH